MPYLLPEYEAFQALTEALAKARDAAKRVGECRSDQKYQWDKVADTLNVTREICFKLVEETVTKQ